MAGARRAGDECAPPDFLPEVYHRYGEGREGAVIPDGLLHHTAVAGGRLLCRGFVEVDPGTSEKGGQGVGQAAAQPRSRGS
ncbi:hypothetical protein ACFWIQ_34995 [Kitasatospora sp. NPDC127059]|uniref:hypothetical protein n=1 Tax=unclassified Kitasatospora TaxID=2633591 RepID=UPI0036683E11